MLSVKRFVGVLIVFLGGMLGIAALLGFAVDGDALLKAIQAPIFETSLQALLKSHKFIFTVINFVLFFFIVVCAMIAFGRRTTYMGFTIMCAALCAGFSSWPQGTPFMLIVIFGAHWIAVAEMQLLAQERDTQQGGDSPPRQGDPPDGSVDSDRSSPSGSGRSADEYGEAQESDAPARPRFWRRFFS